jgi:tRNA threonylcarbamoyl adenosine modification protein (Sua5/YciO/YrdC/YwlC family)
VVFPTDTVYGVAARPEMAEATAALFEAKQRPRDLTLPVLIGDREAVRSLAVTGDRAALLAGRFWPGALTLVLPRTELSRGWELGAARDTIAVRMPDHPVALEVLSRCGPLATTSANRSGEPPPPDCDGVRAALGDAVAVYLCAGPVPAGIESTVVDLTADEPRILREGALPGSAVLGLL